MYKALITDFDGTLASTDKSVCKKNSDAIKKLCDRGFFFAVCTGRMTLSALQVAEKLPVRPPVGAYNGSEITDSSTGKKIYSKALSYEEVLPLIDFAEKHGVNYQLYNDTGVYPAVTNKWTKMYSEVCGCPSTEIKDTRSFMKNVLKTTPKFMIIDEHADEVLPEVLRTFGGKYEIAKCYEGMIDFTPKGVDKGSVVAALAGTWGISADEIVTIGDECNDIPMLKAAGMGVAVANAGEQVRANADFVTTATNDEGAVAEAIGRFVLCE